MQIDQSFQHFVKILDPLYGTSEATSMSRIIFEDSFKIYDFSSTQLLDSSQQETLKTIEERLLKNEPLQYVLGEADFYGLRFKVDPRVLIPRPETEELVYWILEDVKSSGKNEQSILDIGTGSGCIPITLKKENPQLSLHAVDISDGALELALENALKNEVLVDFLQVDILKESNWGEIPLMDIIVSNSPYIPLSEIKLMPKHVIAYEPELALFVENEDPLIFYYQIAKFALEKLQIGGTLYFELNEYNANEVAAMLKQKGFESIIIRKDLSGKDRMIKAMRR